MNSRTLAAKLRAELEPIAKSVMATQQSRIERRTVVSVDIPEGEFTGGTCAVQDGLGNVSFGVRWYENRPKLNDVVLVEFPPPGGTRRVVAICRELTVASGGGGSGFRAAQTLSGEPASSLAPDVVVGASVHVADPVFGGIGDGAEDDTAAIQSAIDAVSENGGGIVTLVGSGIHLTSSAIRITSAGIVLDLNGGTIRRVNTSDGTDEAVLLISGAAGAIVRNGALDGNSKAAYALQITDSSNPVLENLYVFGGIDWQILTDSENDGAGVTQLDARNLTAIALDSAGGIRLDGSPDGASGTVGGRLANVQVQADDGDAFHFGNADTNTVDLLRTTVTGSGRDVVFAGSDTADANARNNHIYHAALSGPVYSLAADFSATGNYVTLNSGSPAPVVGDGSDIGWVSDHVGILGVDALPTLPDAAYPPGKAVVFLRVDDPPNEGGKLYRNVADVWTAAVPAADITDLTSDLILPDGIPPASSPTPTVEAGIGSLVARWTPVANQDLVTYEVHVSGSTGFTPGPTTLYGETPGASIVIRKLPDGSAFAALTTYYVKLIAKDIDGSAAAGAQGSAQVAQAGTDDIEANAITAAKVATDTLTANEIAAGAISTSELAAGAVTAAKITAGTITSNEIAALTIVAANIAAGTITGGKIAAGTITASNIATDTITANEIAAGTITAAEIAANTITTAKLAVTAAVGYVDNSIGGATTYGVTIDTTGITLKDPSGTAVLNGAGFGGSWLSFVRDNVYNGSFDSGPSGGNGTTLNTTPASAVMPNWTDAVIVGTGHGTGTKISWRNDGTVGRAGLVRFQFLSGGTTTDEEQIYAIIPLPSQGSDANGSVIIETDATCTAASSATLQFYVKAQFLKADGSTTTGSEITTTGGLVAGNSVGFSVMPNNGWWKTDAAYVKVKCGIKRNGAANTTTATVDLYAVRVRFSNWIFYVGAGDNGFPGAIVRADIGSGTLGGDDGILIAATTTAAGGPDTTKPGLVLTEQAAGFNTAIGIGGTPSGSNTTYDDSGFLYATGTTSLFYKYVPSGDAFSGVTAHQVPFLDTANVWAGTQQFNAGQRVRGVLTPAQISARADNYAPTGWNDEVGVLAMNLDAARSITGLEARTNGQLVVLHNRSASGGALTISHEDANSTAANRFVTRSGANVSVGVGGSVLLYYYSDATASRWRVIGA